ncbi:hypothetical protein QYE76_003554 [Lolium multiflorum]|uniref:Uncharacterized protein n=1 Tax=Lolium multiflorum TaxID=4521 RepID=A0AAD8W0K4_LOLMU|nr:hypothetical protein QYE76_003554 [Lolium multiflorum]
MQHAGIEESSDSYGSSANVSDSPSGAKTKEGLVKIFEKYDKRIGTLICPPFIQSVPFHPFFTTDQLRQLVKDCEAMLDQLLPLNKPSMSNEDGTENINTETSL